MRIAIIFVLGVVNFALHRAVLDSDHPLIGKLPAYVHLMGGKLTLATEFLILLASMLLAANGWPVFAWIYGAYTAFNAAAAWLIISRRI